MRHEIIDKHEHVPHGYSTYSALLIPDAAWFNGMGISDVWQFFARFKAVGDLIGSDHLAFWFYRKYRGSYMRAVDLHFFCTVPANATPADLYHKVTCGDRDSSLTRAEVENENGYDVARAKHYCAAMNLSFGSGPYIAFFDERPVIPAYLMKSHSRFELEDTKPTAPLYVLKFGGLNNTLSMQLLSALEESILRSGTPEDVARRLRWPQFWIHVQKWCRRRQVWRKGRRNP